MSDVRCLCRGYDDEPTCPLHGVGCEPSAPDARENWPATIDARMAQLRKEMTCPCCGFPMVYGVPCSTSAQEKT